LSLANRSHRNTGRTSNRTTVITFGTVTNRRARWDGGTRPRVVAPPDARVGLGSIDRD
jgi:hypothetical protein